MTAFCNRLLSKSALGAEADDFSADFCSKGGGHSRKARRRTEVKKLPESAVYAANEISKEV